ncbi:MAG: threonine synthase, partial [Desulfovibrio sp.]|nr:threonine synthase [Desulfovibrio sp.]
MNFPTYRGHLQYVCLGCGATYDISELHYTCPKCSGVFVLQDLNFAQLKATPAAEWRRIFDERAASKIPALRGIFRFYELMAPVLEQEDILYLGEGNTPLVDSPPALRAILGLKTVYKNDGQNPSASFKDRGMACAFSFLKSLIRTQGWTEVLAICASTGDTSASAALYASYVGGAVKSAVILPAGKVTP